MFISLEQIRQAKYNLANVIVKTPLQYSKTFSDMSENEVCLKPECLQKTGAFKVRGAYNKMCSLTPEQKAKGVVTCSAGNHGAGTAYAAMLHGIKATVVMPEVYVQAKKDAVDGYGARVIPFGKTSGEMFKKTYEIIEEEGGTMIHPFDDPYTIAGQGTIGLEIVEEWEAVDVVIVPVSGGGLISGIASAVKQMKPAVKIIGVNAENSRAMLESLKVDQPVEYKASTFADGLTAAKPGNLNFEYVKKYVDEMVTVSESEIRDAVKLIGERAKLVVEPSGAAALAALIYNKTELKNKKIVVILSGGNVDFGLLSKIYNGTLEV